jgi:hypothetical protein
MLSQKVLIKVLRYKERTPYYEGACFGTADREKLRPPLDLGEKRKAPQEITPTNLPSTPTIIFSQKK